MTTPYELIYYVGVPGRGEHVRLILEEAGASYTDTQSLPPDQVRAMVTKTLNGGQENPPYFAPPLLRHDGLLISQTSNIIMYIGSQLGLAGQTASDTWRVNALALTALDGLSNEVHDTHHPIAIELAWEDQKEESVRRSKEWVTTRLPKLLTYWQQVLSSEVSASGPWLLGKDFTYADLVLFQASILVFLFTCLTNFARFQTFAN
jgi:glutathione S-transferase